MKVQTLYERNTRRRTIKVYAGIATLAFAREPSVKAKESITVSTGIEHTTSHARAVRASAVPSELIGTIRIYINDKAVK